MPAKKGKNCVSGVMKEWKRGDLHSGTGKKGKKGPVVKDQKQAVAIALNTCNNSEAGAVEELESKLLSMSSHSYDAIDKEMKKISKAQGITPKQLHDQFKSKHNGQIPDEWIKDQTSTDNSEMDNQDFMCKDGKCGQCPMCDKKKEMMAIGYSEEAVDAVLIEMEAKYGEKKGLWANIHAKRERIKRGSGERMRRPGEKGAPSAEDLRAAGGGEGKKGKRQGKKS